MYDVKEAARRLVLALNELGWAEREDAAETAAGTEAEQVAAARRAVGAAKRGVERAIAFDDALDATVEELTVGFADESNAAVLGSATQAA